MEGLSISFPINYEGRKIYSYLAKETNPDPEEAAKAEKELAWRGAMAESIRTIASNFSDGRLRELVDQHPFDSLELPNLCIVPVSEFSTDAFHNMLSRLQSFHLSLLGNISEITLNIHNVFNGFSDCLGPWFLNHLSSVEKLVLEPGSAAPLGRAGQEFGQNISLRDARMPNLAEMEFQNLFICEELVDFFVRHADTLESVTLEHCYAFDSSTTCWKDLFAALVKASPSRLTTFCIIEICDKHDRLNLDNQHEQSDPDSLARVRAKLESEPDAIAFPYGYTYYDDRDVYEDYSVNQARFLQGDDCRAYRELRAIIDANSRACESDQDGHGD